MELFVKKIFEDADIVVVNKPAGMIVNNADTSRNVETLQDWVEKNYHITGESEFAKRAGIVHRLDKETSGILIVAKNEESFINLQAEFKKGMVSKVYTALVHGKVTPESGEIFAPIGRLPWNRMRFGVYPQGRESKTLYKVLEVKRFITDKSEEVLSLVELYPKTGRTHQIRVHMQYLGFPLFADALYAGRKNSKKDRKVLSRHFLHASKISFTHPVSGKRIEIESPLSPELVDFLAQLV